MKTSITHLPEEKQKEIQEILQIIIDVANPEKVILFGSHANGNWVEDEYIENGTTYSYMSDYDFLIVIKKGNEIKEHDISSQIENRTLKYKNEISPIIHDIDYINQGLERGQYFFQDIVNKGILLFDSNQYHFEKAKVLTREEEKEMSKYYYKKWIESGERFLVHTENNFRFAVKNNYPLNEVIFILHQTTERLYAGLLLVYTGYKPKTHSLKHYKKYSKNLSEDLNRVFCYPLDNVEELRLFKILQKSYLDSRYKDDYFISEGDLRQLIIKVEKLKDIVIKLSKERFDSLV